MSEKTTNTFEAICPSCAFQTKVAASMNGKRAKCPKCGARFVLSADDSPISRPQFLVDPDPWWSSFTATFFAVLLAGAMLILAVKFYIDWKVSSWVESFHSSAWSR